MKDYLNMFECFPELDCDGNNLMCGNVLVANFVEVDECEYTAHAINSHDELVEMNNELIAALKTIGVHTITDEDGDEVEVLFGNMRKIKEAIEKFEGGSV